MDENTDAELAQYDMIVGDDLLTELRINLLYTDQTMVWEGDGVVTMKPRGYIQESRNCQHIYMWCKLKILL